MKVLEIVCLENGDVVLVEAPTDANGDVVERLEPSQNGAELLQPEQQPLVSIRFSPDVKDMLGDDAYGVAEAMIEAATAYISDAAEPEFGDLDLEVVSELGGELGAELGAELDSVPTVEYVRSSKGQRDPDHLNPDRPNSDLDDFEDQVSTIPVVLH